MSISDLGGRREHFAPVARDDDAGFHSPWEKRVFGMTMLAAAALVGGNVDAMRASMERLPAKRYFENYWGRWLGGLELVLERHPRFHDRRREGELPVKELPTEGRAAPPRTNGELVFEAPWERDVFGVAIAAFEKRLFSWPDFQARLIEAIDARERENAAFHYYACWASALERVLLDAQVLGAEELARATHEHEALFTHQSPDRGE